ncbi:DoxX family protein [Crenothrix sp.]|uniref:DoxX family protein n=1 Tax=Crenothrix sp. TaxID=3100433 RepID=UPI00374DAFF6
MKNVINTLLISHAGWEAVILRLPIGLILAAHGSQKLLGWFGGQGLDGAAQLMASLGLHPGFLMALAAGSAEFFGGVALMVGLFTRFAAAIVSVTLAVALFWVHWSKGFFLTTHGVEYALALLSATAALMIMGGGRFSVDRYLLESHLFDPNDNSSST